MTTKTYFDERASLGSRSKSLIEIASKLSAAMEQKHTGSKKRQETRDMRNLEKHYFFLKKDYQILTIAYKLRGGNPLEYIGKVRRRRHKRAQQFGARLRSDPRFA